MPSKSKAQQKFMGMVHALQKGDIEPSDVSQDVRDAAKSMKKKDAKDFASTSHKGLPKKVKQEILNRLKEYANKMGTDHLGGDDYTSSKKGGLRDNDGYDNVDYNPNMKMDESVNEATAKPIKFKWLKVGEKWPTGIFIKKRKDGKYEIHMNRRTYEAPIQVSGLLTRSNAISQANHILNNGSNEHHKLYIDESVKTITEGADYKYLTQTILDAKPKYNVYYNSGHNKVNIGGVGYDSGELVKQFNQKPGSSSKIKNNFYYADQDPQKTKREVEKLSKGKIKVDIQKGYGGKPMAVYIVKESVNEGPLPQNWMQGRTSDYHTKLRGKEREYDDTNFDKENSGQPDIEESFASDLDMIKRDSKNLKDFIKKVLSDSDFRSLKGDRDFIKYLSSMYNESVQESFDKVEHLKLLNLALRTMPGSQKQKEIIRKLNKVRVAGGMRPLKETSIIEYASKLTLSYLPADAEEIEKMNEGIMIRRAVDIAQEILPKNTWAKYASDGKKNKEYVKSIVRDLAQLLNRFYKSHDVDMRLKEEVLNEVGLWRIDQYTNSDKGLVPGRFATVKNEKDREKKRALEKDLAQTLNGFWKRWSIPYRIDITKIER